MYKLGINIKDYNKGIDFNESKVYKRLCTSRIVGCIQSGCRETTDDWHHLSSH